MASAVMERSKKDEVKLSKTLSRKRKVEPSKRTLNLVIKEKTSLDAKKWIPGVLIVLILVAVFGKFAVYDRFMRLEERENELSALKTNLAEIQEQYADYDEVKEQHSMYSYEGYNRTLVDRLEVMDMLKRLVFPACEVQSLSIAGKTINMSITDLNLSQLSQLISKLEAEPMVARVTVYNTNDGNEVSSGSASMSVELKDATTIEEGETK